MSVDLRGYIGMAEQFLHRANVLAALSKCVLRPDHTLQPRQLYLQHLLVQKQNRRQRLVLRGRRNITAHRQITEKGLHFRRAHILWMSVLMKTALLASTGLNEEGMQKWHAEFEKMSPDAHQDFLESLGIAPGEITSIHQFSRRPATERDG